MTDADELLALSRRLPPAEAAQCAAIASRVRLMERFRDEIVAESQAEATEAEARAGAPRELGTVVLFPGRVH